MFAPCPGCQRHVRLSDEVCPFCKASCGGLVAKPVAAGRYSRAGLIAVTAALAVGAAAIVATPGCTIQDHGEAMYGCPPTECVVPEPDTDASTNPPIVPADASVGDVRLVPSPDASDAAADSAADAGADGDAAMPE
jgi:hypothetical protein